MIDAFSSTAGLTARKLRMRVFRESCGEARSTSLIFIPNILLYDETIIRVYVTACVDTTELTEGNCKNRSTFEKKLQEKKE